MYAKSAEIINCLRQHDVDFDAVNKKNDTPFHCARAAGFPVAFQKGCMCFFCFDVLYKAVSFTVPSSCETVC